MGSAHIFEFAVDGSARYDHFGDVNGDIIDGAAVIFCQIKLVGFPYMSNAEPSVYSFVYSNSQEYRKHIRATAFSPGC